MASGILTIAHAETLAGWKGKKHFERCALPIRVETLEKGEMQNELGQVPPIQRDSVSGTPVASRTKASCTGLNSHLCPDFLEAQLRSPRGFSEQGVGIGQALT